MNQKKITTNDRLNQKSIQSSKGKQEANDSIDPIKARKPQRQVEDKTKKKRKLLSFEDEIEQQPSIVPKIKKSVHVKAQKNPIEMLNAEDLERKLKEQYIKQSERVKQQLIQLQFCYWDGQNVVKKIRRKKRDTVQQFLQVCRLDLIENFQNIASVQVKDLLFVIKDFIAPHEMSLADVEILKLKTTKNDFLLNLRNVKIKKDGKELTLSVNLDGPVRIVERSRYEKNKSSFPFCNWQTLNLKEK